MDEPILRSRRGIVGVLVVAGVIAAITVALFTSTNDETRTIARSDSTPTPTTTEDRLAIRAIVTQFAQAVRTGDGDALYAIQASSYLRGCSRADFEAVVASVKGQLFTDVTGIEIEGDQALASVTLQIDPDTTVSQTIPLQREADGNWKLESPAEGSCTP